ncbi:ATP-binding protein [Schumannella sp. 10F1B-5-1]|uniref:ATP-binding protein n=1 Tax=Schumannella sp. 10F1B-5-1 TaxID=2590780 RepID=UPI001130D77A|nr:ATP-binding protein [Schumannella sp. 10F1B-5-1]TPW73496.1 ATP-binding protein [Schumannella sp. 10F1B-5-1]
MDQLTNPYTPNAGAEPPVIVGREDQIASFSLLLGRLQRGRTEQSMMITGLRGVGKTVLLGKFREISLAENWVVLELEVSKHDEAEFRRVLGYRVRTALLELSPRSRWSERAKRAAAILRSFSVSVDPAGSLTAGIDLEIAEGYGDHADLGLDLVDLLVAVGEAAAEAGRGLVMLIDEIQFLSSAQFEAVIGAIHKVVQRRLPVTLVGAGLPQIPELAGDAKSYAERLFKFPEIGSLDRGDADAALASPASEEQVSFSPEALRAAFELTGGYPYFIQELGYAAWSAAAISPIEAVDIASASEVYESKLDSSFFRVRLDRATALQRRYLRAMAELGPEPQKASDVAELMGRRSTQLGPTRAELINMGLLYTPQHGYAAFTVPHFDRFMHRAMPEGFAD